jgi:hypothetical protein
MSNLDNLLQTPPSELVTDLKTLRDERGVTEGKEAVLEQLLEMRSREGGTIADEIAALGAAVGIGPLRNQIAHVLTTRRGEGLRLMVPKGIQDELVARGNRAVTLDNVRVTMKRMADAGELVRPDPESLLYGLPDTPGVEEALEEFKAKQQAHALQVLQANAKKRQSR